MKKISGLIIVFALIGCVSTNSVQLGTAKGHQKIISKEVIIYRTADQVPGEYEEVALLNSSADSLWTDEKGMYKSMQKKASKFGANGIILDAVSEPSAGSKVAAFLLWGAGANRKGKAIAIYVFPEGSKAPRLKKE